MFSSALKTFTSNISSNYTVATQPSAVSGPWKIFDGKKKSTGKAVSVFVFDRKSLEPQGGGLGGRSSASSLKRAHDEVVDRLKKEASSLARLRHPSILELAEPVEDTRSGGLMFATESVTASLAGVLEEKSEQEGRGGVGGRGSRFVVEDSNGRGRRRREVEIDELEIQKGLLQVAKGLEFLHESASLVHANLTPDAIFINAKSDWKISGLGFSTPPDNSTGATSVSPISLAEVLQYDARLPRSVQMNVDYSSPDFVIDTNISSSADMFSLGLIIIALYNSPHRSPLDTSQSISTYKRTFSSPSSIPQHNNNFLCTGNLPKDIKGEVLPKLITRRPAQRYSAREFQQAQYFDNVLVSTIRFLDSLPAKSPSEKSQFMRGLPRILGQFPKSVLEKKVLPALLEETKDVELLSLVLQNSFKTIDLVTNGRRAMSERILPALRSTFLSSAKGQSQERDAAKEAGLVVVLDNMATITANCSGKEFKDDVLPILYLGLESPTHSLVDHALQTLPTILPTLDFSTIKNELFPVIATVFSKTSSMAIKIRGLEALNSLCGGTNEAAQDQGDGLDGFRVEDKKPSSSAILDKYTVQEKVVPLLKAIKTKEPAVMMAALAVFRQVGKVADSDFLAMDVLPCLWAFSLGPLLNLEQFQSFMALIKSLSSRIEQEQTRKLSELSASSGASRRGVGAASFGGTQAANGVGLGDSGADDTDFESLVTGRKGGIKNDDLLDGGWGTAQAASARPSAPRTTSQQKTSTDIPRFSWSTAPNSTGAASPAIQSPPRGGFGSGTITPDNTMGSFAALTPSARPTVPPTGSTMQPMQPTRPGFGATSSTSSQQTTRVSTIGTSVDWSRAGSSSNAWASQASPPLSQPLSPATGSSISSFQPLGQSMGQPMSPPSGAFSSFSIAPPPANAGRGMASQIPSNTAPRSSAPNQKQGLDKYESLI